MITLKVLVTVVSLIFPGLAQLHDVLTRTDISHRIRIYINALNAFCLGCLHVFIHLRIADKFVRGTRSVRLLGHRVPGLTKRTGCAVRAYFEHAIIVVLESLTIPLFKLIDKFAFFVVNRLLSKADILL